VSPEPRVARSNPLQDWPGLPDLRRRIDERLLAAVETDDPRLTEMTSHLVKAGGKRLRPLLVALSSAAVRIDGHNGDDEAAVLTGAVSDAAVTGGVAVELAHVGSLHHDDVIDESTTRHNVDSVNMRWGNLRAILSGDFLLARASELAASLGTEIASILARTIGRLCAGEVRELHTAYAVDRSDDDYFTAIAGKTAALYSSGCRIGGLAGGAVHVGQLDALTDFGMGFGMAFQVVDDVLDVVATDHELGKPAGHDMAEGVYNLPVLRALTGPEGPELRTLLGGPLDDEPSRARALALVREGDGVGLALQVARDYVDQAVGSLKALPPNPARDALAAAAHHLVDSTPT
jgi:heptaprenyl diphosphate synthase